MSTLALHTLTNTSVVTDAVDTVDVTTDFAKKIALYPFSLQYNSASIDLFGNKIVGIGRQLSQRASAEHPGLTSYLYNSTGIPINPVHNMPIFIKPDLTYDSTSLTAYANISSVFSDTDIKKGIIAHKSQLATMLNNSVGQTYYWGPEQALGYINTFAVCTDDIRNLKYKSASDDKIFSGMQIKDADDEFDTSCTWFKNGIAGLTPDDAIFIRYQPGGTVYSYNLVTGAYNEVTGLGADTIMPIWGTQMYEVQDILYFLAFVSNDVHLCSRNLETGFTEVGSVVSEDFSITGTLCGNLVRMGTDYFYSVPSRSSRVLSFTFKKLDFSDLSLTDVTTSFSVSPDLNLGHVTVSTIEGGLYLVTDCVRGVSFVVPSLQDISSATIQHVYFTCCGICCTCSVSDSVYLIGYGKGAINSSDSSYMYMILDSDTSPLLGYGTTSVVHEKTERNTITFTHIFNIS